MPKVGAEPLRKAALIDATISAVGRAGTLDVTVAQIARQAGMSTALAHYYFGSKDQIFLAAMRHILGTYGRSVRSEMPPAPTPRQRLEAILRGSFDASNFDGNTISAWLNFYALAQVNPQAARLLRVYHRRLRSNLLAALRPLTPRAEAVADTLGALIDGLYLRAALQGGPVDAASALRLCTAYADEALAAKDQP